FPDQTFNAANYWVDVVFADSIGPDTSAPSIVSSTPASGAPGVSPSTTVAVVFSEDMAAASIGSSTFELRGPSNTLVPATVTYNAATRTMTLQPSAALSLSTVYTVNVFGGSTGPAVTDTAGNPLAATATWS